MAINISFRPHRLTAGIALALLAGCTTVGPDYAKPDLHIAPQWVAALPHEGKTESLLNWWKGFNDPALITLMEAAEKDSPTLTQAAAAISAARATYERNGSNTNPAATLSSGITRAGSNDPGPVAATSTGRLDASWEIDLFGGLRRSTQAAEARLSAREAEWHGARVSLAAEVADEYMRFRACTLLRDHAKASLTSFKHTVQILESGVMAGLRSESDVALAQAGVMTAAATVVNQETECALSIKALVALTGMEEARVLDILGKHRQSLPAPHDITVAAIPLQLLSQRPDLAAAEHSLAASSADIGVAEAGKYPRLSLLGSISTLNTSISGNASSTESWSIGPSLRLPIFDGGAAKAQVTIAEASYQASLAAYQLSIRRAVKEVEQSLVLLDAAERRHRHLESSARQYRAIFALAEQNWQAGRISLLTLEESRRNAIQSEQSAILAARDRLTYAIALYKALGGGWTRQQTESAGVAQ